MQQFQIILPNPDKSEPKFCHFAKEIVVKCLTVKISEQPDYITPAIYV